MLAGCGGSQPPIGATGAIPQTTAIATHAERGESWMLPEAKSEDLLYISDGDKVYVYSYPKQKLVGTLKGFNDAAGLCVDKAGDVWIGNTAGIDKLSLIEYEHGGSKPNKTLSDSSEGSADLVSACSVDPTTGNLAAVNWGGGGESNPGNIAIFPNASGPPTVYSSYMHAFGGAYDRSGDLFVDGALYESNPNYALYELSAGKKTFKYLRVTQQVQAAGGLQWDGRHLALGDINANIIYRFAIHGRRATTVGSTALGDADEVVDFSIQGAKVIGPNNLANTAMTWKYPAGGAPVATITNLDTPWGATISRALK
jgi:hypothetical protein